jgi:predicted nucleic acid-binding protein
MRALLDTSVLIEAERRNFDLDRWVEQHEAEIVICDATVAEFLAGEPLKDEGKRKRFREFWETVGSQLPSLPLDRAVCERAGALLLLARTKRRTVPLGDALHGAVAELEGLTVLTVDTEHFKEVGVPALNPLAGLGST